ncbi:MAG: type 1 glutamine amidotransferase domain-containing protein [Ideonella sp. MAG2]|nr:MAG: type 1 glutamine amidotransferase domain-containing protein [Ideonella sp. MAG2]
MNKRRFFSVAASSVLALSALGFSPLASASESTASKGRVLLVAANPAQASNGWPIGVWAAEISHPYDELVHAGYSVDIASPQGGDLFIDPYSDPRHESGYSAQDIVSLGFLTSPKTAPLLKATRPLSAVNASDYAAIIVAGGQSPMYTFRKNPALQQLIVRFYEAGKPTAALCHGVAALVEAKLSTGRPLLAGKKVTGFSLAEDQFVEKAVGAKLFDWYVEPAMKEKGALYQQGGMWADYAVADGHLITGQQQHSGRSVARLVLAQLKK